MNPRIGYRPKLSSVGLALALAPALTASAGTVYWTDWKTSTTSGSAFTGYGTITTPTSTVEVTYSNPQGISFYQTAGPAETDYFANGPGDSGRNAATSPYTSTAVDNIPTEGEMIALTYAGSQTLSFSEPIANPYFSYVSLNGNGYAFDQDFEILSVGGVDGNSPGYWGSGTSFKSVVDLGGGDFEYQLLGTGEPHGTIRFLGSFGSVTWRSLSSENWNGFTVGVAGTSAEVFGVPDAGVSALVPLAGLLGAAAFYRRRTWIG